MWKLIPAAMKGRRRGSKGFAGRRGRGGKEDEGTLPASESSPGLPPEAQSPGPCASVSLSFRALFRATDSDASESDLEIIS